MPVTALGTDYLLPEDVTPAALRKALAARFEVESEAGKAVDRVYFDTFEGLVRKADMSLVWEAGWLALVSGDGREVAGLGMPGTPTAVRVSELPPGALRDRLAPVIGVRAATALACMRVRRRNLRVLNSESKTVARLGIEQPSVALRGSGRAALQARLNVVGVRGYDRALGRVRRVVEDKLGLLGAAEPLVDEAMSRKGGLPGAVSPVPSIELEPRQRADSATAAILTQLIASIENNLPGTLADVDTEFLHDLRVAVRRTRSLQRELAGVFPEADLRRFRAGFRWLQEITGPTRDLDVYLLDFDEFVASLPPERCSDLEPLRALLTERRDCERRRMVRALRSGRAHALIIGWKELVATFPELPEDDRPDAARPIGELAGRRIARTYRRMVEMGTAIEDQSPSVALHDLRKRGKELRYLLEFFGGLFPAATVEPMVKTLKSLQDTLGRFQDREIQAAMLSSVADETATREDGPAALMAMGVLVERLSAQQAEARAEFAERFAPFADRRRRAAIKGAFA